MGIRSILAQSLLFTLAVNFLVLGVVAIAAVAKFSIDRTAVNAGGGGGGRVGRVGSRGDSEDEEEGRHDDDAPLLEFHRRRHETTNHDEPLSPFPASLAAGGRATVTHLGSRMS